MSQPWAVVGPVSPSGGSMRTIRYSTCSSTPVLATSQSGDLHRVLAKRETTPPYPMLEQHPSYAVTTTIALQFRVESYCRNLVLLASASQMTHEWPL